MRDTLEDAKGGSQAGANYTHTGEGGSGRKGSRREKDQKVLC